MKRQEIFDYYSRQDIIKEIVKNSANREAVGAFFDGSYDKRPNMIQFPSDITTMVRNGVTSFHFSVERWSNAMGVNQENYDTLRTGFDVIIDIDSKLDLIAAEKAALQVCNLLEKYGIKNYGIKFSGRRGFHIVLPWEMLPKEIDYSPLKKMYPKVPRIIAYFIREKIKEDLMKELMRNKTAKELISALDEPPSELSPYLFVELEKDWGNRHMFRAPYSLNEKTWLASVPITKDQLKNFNPDAAKPENVFVREEFFKGQENEAELLLLEAMDWHAAMLKDEKKKETKKVVWEDRIPEEMFPPCIKILLQGLKDGKKRSIFTLASFLRMMNWKPEEIDERIREWNEKNEPKLTQAILNSSLRWNYNNAMTPANCDNTLFYESIGICRPDIICKNATENIVIKNPIAYPFKKMAVQKKYRPAFRGYSCLVCGKEFKNMKSLSIHKGRVHDIFD